MDNLTHSLVGALIGQAGLKRKTGLAMPALIIGANLPDIDAACFFWLDGVEHLAFRRGITHGPPALVLLPLLLAGALWWFDRWQAGRGKKRFGRPEGRLPVQFGWLYGLAFLGCLTHPALDWLNVYGIRLLEPFSSEWFYGDTLFIIDVWLWALMGFATWFSLRREKRGGEWRKPARVAMAVGLAYIGVNGLITAYAEERTSALVRHGYGIEPSLVVASPPPLIWWNREVYWRRDEYDRMGDGAFYGDGEFSILDPIYLIEFIRDGQQPQVTFDSAVRSRAWTYARSFRFTNRRVECLRQVDPDFNAFSFWSRMPIVIEGNEFRPSLLLDQRFMEPRARDRFSVALPDVKCEPVPDPSP